MNIKILGTESIGVCGLLCEEQVEDRRVMNDPGITLGYLRHRLLPHPQQAAVGEQIRREIVAALQDATEIVLSHFHGDHIPMPDANPYRLSAHHVVTIFRAIHLWSKEPDGLSQHMAA